MSTVTSGVDVAAAASTTPLNSSPIVPANLTVPASSLSKLTSALANTHTLLIFPLRMMYRVEIFIFVTIPRELFKTLRLDMAVSSLLSGVIGIFGEDGGNTDGTVAEAVAATVTTGTDGATSAGVAAEAAEGSGFSFLDIIQNTKRFGGFFSYMTSRWSLACFAVALLLNRVTVYAATRRHITLNWTKRLALRLIPIVLLATQILSLLRAIRCQTSPAYPTLRYGKPGNYSSLDYAGEGGFLYHLSSSLLFWEDDQSSCRAASMGKPSGGEISYGSFSLLWPVFIRICVSHIVETLSCALQGRPVATETGMSIFEHSLAFAEAESVISTSVGLGLFGHPKPGASTEGSTSASSVSPAQLLPRSQVLERLNVTPELLLIALISCCNNLASNILDVFGRQARYRLFNTTVWGLCFMGALVWGFFDMSLSLVDEIAFLRFPTVCIVGFVPHILILVGILTCLSIYVLALFLTALSLSHDDQNPMSFREKLVLARENMQSSSQFRSMRLNMHEDFYTALVRVGYACLTAASEAVFLNEGKPVISRDMTWLEEDRLAEIITSRNSQQPRSQEHAQVQRVLADIDGFNFGLPDQEENWESGYGRETKLEKRSGARSASIQSSFRGVGTFAAPTRIYLGFAFFRSIFFLIVGWMAFGLCKFLERLGFATPACLRTLAGIARKANGENKTEKFQSLDFWILTEEGELKLPQDYEFDVEKEMRKREAMDNSNGQWGEAEERQFEGKLYNWWKAGGSWGNQDESGDYIPSSDDSEDTTSVISTSTNDDSVWESDESDGRRTPTQREPYPSVNRFSRASTPLHETILDPASLARLLDPKDNESKQEARILASHLMAEQNGRIMTRSQYRAQMERERARILTSNRLLRQPAGNSDTSQSNERKRPTPDEEAEILERLILSKRQPKSQKKDDAGWPEAPHCVVCQCAPRSIIAWPCRCLCVCEDCRVSLALNNFGTCVTCRRDVHGFVRLWVP
ncbi:hypothetical protein VTO42DRAFT_7706 [Malbranchea cinnamomea]